MTANAFFALLERLNARLYNALASVAGGRLREGAPSRSSAKRPNRSEPNLSRNPTVTGVYAAASYKIVLFGVPQSTAETMITSGIACKLRRFQEDNQNNHKQ